MTDNLADRLALAAEQMNMTSERANAITADDIGAVADYLDALTQHGHHVCAVALNAIDTTEPEHPTRGPDHGIELQAALGHLRSLFDAAIHFAFEAQRASDQLAAGEED